jgi:hypothetical protein
MSNEQTTTRARGQMKSPPSLDQSPPAAAEGSAQQQRHGTRQRARATGGRATPKRGVAAAGVRRRSRDFLEISPKKASKPSRSAPERADQAAEPQIERTPANAAAVLQAAIGVMAEGVDAIRTEIELIRAGKGGQSKHDNASRVAFLAAKAGTIGEAMRKHEAARLKRIQALSPDVVLAWYRQLDQTGREHILRELMHVDSRRSGLG